MEYDVSPDGQRFLIGLLSGPSASNMPQTRTVLVNNFVEQLRAVVPR
jgi:hypothetical protein